MPLITLLAISVPNALLRMPCNMDRDAPLIPLCSRNSSKKWLITLRAMLVLTPEISAAVLSYLNESVQNEILYRVAKLNDVNRDVVDELDRLIERGLSVLSEHGSKVKGIKQAADIVNRFQGNQQVILDQMRERDEEVLGQIQDEMYDFFILSRQNEEVRRRLLDEVPMEDWAVALKGTEALLRRSIYAVMPKRQAQQLEAITARLGPVPVSRIEQIRREIMGIARELEEAGEIQLQLFAERTAE